MKRKYADRRGWRRIVKKRITEKAYMWPEFHGRAVLLHFDEIKAPMSVVYGGVRNKTVDKNYSWLQLFPEEDCGFVLTAMFNQHHQLVQCYFDIVKQIGREGDGVLWFDDLYLDFILFPDRSLYFVDEEELDEALETGMITQALHDRAWDKAGRLKIVLERHPDRFLHLVRKMITTFPEAPDAANDVSEAKARDAEM
jgi:predicted RNA-binding protein associated with RNAse of E/G family